MRGALTGPFNFMVRSLAVVGTAAKKAAALP